MASTVTGSQQQGMVAAEAPTSVWSRVLATQPDYSVLVARLALALVIFPHGAQKALGWYGGHGFSGTMGFFTQQMGIPAPFALLAIAAEFLGALGLFVGLFGRVAAFGIMVTMAVAAWMVHLPHGFFMNWYGVQAGEGLEYFILAIGLALVVILKGSGALSLDGRLTKRTDR